MANTVAQKSPPPTATSAPAADPIETSVIELIEKGRSRGFLTWEELNDALPDEAEDVDPAERLVEEFLEVHASRPPSGPFTR